MRALFILLLLLLVSLVPVVDVGAVHGQGAGLAIGIADILMMLFGLFLLPLPVEDNGTVRYRSVPWMTISLIVVNVVAFVLWEGLPYFEMIAVAQTESEVMEMYIPFAEIIWTYGSRPSFIYEHQSIGAFSAFTSMFMHGNLSHLLGNMFYLWAFGRRVEDACGPWRFLVFYLLAGMLANVGYLVLAPQDAFDRPGVGASGAISGVMGAFLILFPGVNISCLWGLGFGLRRSWVAAIIAAFMSGYLFIVGGIDDLLFALVIALRLIFLVQGWAMRQSDEPGFGAGFSWTVSIPAWILLVFFAIDNITASFAVIQGADMGGVNTIAHMTGFLAAITIFLYVRKDLLTRYISGRRL